MHPSNLEYNNNKNQTPLPQVSAADKNYTTIHQEQQHESIFSSQKSIMDYVTLEGIENRTGIEKQNVYAFVLKELLDNATDFLETQHSGIGIISRSKRIGMSIIPAAVGVQVTILKEEGNKFLRIIVTNSNEYGKAVFSKDMLQSIFDFDTFYSSKRNQYKISRGALGDALKEVLCIPCALTREQQQNPIQWNEPLIIITKINRIQQTFRVDLITDRVNQTIGSQITESNEEEEKSKEHIANFTAIQVRLPIVQSLLDLAKLEIPSRVCYF
jgi:hypothetical protein